ncbi:hypothetical protein P4B35_07925 [Pontiellaceae bacterium B12227]|nr:hypothetical protein [Pontiellaceae bacterium B12227]
MKPEGESANSVETEARRSSRDETLSFLNSLPEVHKPKPKPERSLLDEHLAFLSSLPGSDSQPAAVAPVPEPEPVMEVTKHAVPENSPPKQKKAGRKVKKRNHQQLMKEEKNRLEKERAEAKRIEMQQRRQEAEERERRIALEREQDRLNQQAILEEKSKAGPKQSLFKKLVGA